MAVRDPEEKRNYMLNTPLPRLITMMALPSIAGMMVSSAYNLADTLFVSRLGTLATGAVGVNGSIDNLIMMAGSLLGTGAASYTSRLLGGREDEHAQRVLSTCFYIAFFLGMLVLTLGTVFTGPMLRLLGASAEIMPYSRQYARFVLLAAPFMASSYVLNQCLRAEGSAVYSMVGMSLGAILNIALDPLFIFTFNWGVAGASAATALSKLVSWIILMIPYWRGNTLLKIKPRYLRPSFMDTKEVSIMGSASFFRNCLGTLAIILLNRMAVSYGASALAAISVTNRIMMFLISACLGFGQGFQPVAGYSWGSGHYDRVREGYRFASFACVIGISLIAGTLAVFARPLILLFTEDDQELVRIGVFALRAQCMAMPFHGFCIVVNMLCAGIGRGLGSLLIGTSRQGSCFFPVLPILSWLFGVWGIACVQAVADVLSMFLAVPIARRVMKDVRRLEAEQLAAQNG